MSERLAVMAPNTGRQFKHVFNEAQEQLRSIFGMELTELPSREKVTVSQKRAAQRSGTQSTSSSTSKAYILTSTLPIRYRHPKILPPPKIPSAAAEASYVGLVTFVLSLIYLSPARTISESRLEKHLRRMNADNYVLNGEKTEKVLKRMEKEGYVSKVRERDGGGEETVDYVLGSRGKVEVGERGVAGLVRKVYGKKDAEAEELDKRLVRSLGDIVIDRKRRPVDGEVEEEEEAVVDGEQEVEEEVQEEPTGRGNRKKQTPTQPKPTRGSSGRARNRGRDEIEVEVEEAEEEGEEGEEDAEEDVAEEDDEEESDE